LIEAALWRELGSKEPQSADILRRAHSKNKNFADDLISKIQASREISATLMGI
jgi:hypothetical protein